MVEIRCENCGSLLAVASEGADVEGTVEIKCDKCKEIRIVSGKMEGSSKTHE